MRFILFLVVITSCFLMVYVTASFAGVDLPWSSTYDCNEWDQSMGITEGIINCDGLAGNGNWTCGQGGTFNEQITSDANYSGGGGGKGQRQWVGDGIAENSGGLRIYFNSAEREFSIRWYMRYWKGFKWEYRNNDKLLYTYPGSVAEFKGGDSVAIAIGPATYTSPPGTGWNTVMVNGEDYNGYKTSDGEWHLMEVHMKVDTDGSNGEFHFWIDEVLRYAKTDLDYGTHAGWTYIRIGENSNRPELTQCRPVDWDDIAIRKTGYIGPITGGTPDTIKPGGPFQKEPVR